MPTNSAKFKCYRTISTHFTDVHFYSHLPQIHEKKNYIYYTATYKKSCKMIWGMSIIFITIIRIPYNLNSKIEKGI